MDDTYVKLIKVLRFLEKLDDYSLWIVLTLLKPHFNKSIASVADLARLHGVSRQAMHRKVVASWKKYPELRTTLKCILKMAQGHSSSTDC